MNTRISVDYERNCEVWWDAMREAIAAGNPPPACIELLGDADHLVVSDNEAAEFLSWASRLPGWDEGPFVVNEEA